MKIIQWLALFIGAFVLQTTLVPHFAIGSIYPDLTVLLLFILARSHGPVVGVWVGFALGLSHDLYAPSLLGQSALALSLTGFVAGLFNERMMKVDIAIQCVLLAATFVTFDLAFSTVQAIKTSFGAGQVALSLLTHTLPRTIYTIAVFALFHFVKNFITPIRK